MGAVIPSIDLWRSDMYHTRPYIGGTRVSSPGSCLEATPPEGGMVLMDSERRLPLAPPAPTAPRGKRSRKSTPSPGRSHHPLEVSAGAVARVSRNHVYGRSQGLISFISRFCPESSHERGQLGRLKYMKMQRFVMVGAVLALALAVVGCAKPPVEEQNAAKQALDNARANAEKWAPNEWRSAQQAFDDANKEIETQNNRFALMRNYDKAKQMLGDAKAASERAKQAGTENKETAKKEAEAKLGEAETLITEAR